jgi:hypothetical protein
LSRAGYQQKFVASVDQRNRFKACEMAGVNWPTFSSKERVDDAS